MREVHLHIHAIPSAQRRLALEVVASLSLPCPLAASQLGGIGIEGCQRIGLVLRKCRQVVDERRGANHRPLAAKRHILAPFSLQQQTKSFLRIRTGEQGSTASIIAVPVVERRILRLLGILRQQAPRAFVQHSAHIPRIDEFREIILMGNVGKNFPLLLILVHPRGTQRQFRTRLRETGNPFVQCHLGISAAYQALVPRPVATLTARQSLHGHTLCGFQHQTSAQQRIVDAQRTFLIGTQDESRTELLVECSCRQLGTAQATLYPEMGHAPPFEVAFEARQRMIKVLKAQACIHILALHLQIHIGVCQYVTRFLGANHRVVLRQQHVALNAAVQRNGLLAVSSRLLAINSQTSADNEEKCSQ